MDYLVRYLPQMTPIDPSEDPADSIDPLGLSPTVARLSEIILPGMTLRMWRVRFLTYAALASLVTQQVVESLDYQGDKLEIRLAFERLFVSAMIRSSLPQKAIQRLPGRQLAERAWRENDRPLKTSNFLKGQAVNGPFGVIARLAHKLDILDNDDQLLSRGEELLFAWAMDQRLFGLLGEPKSQQEGARWLWRITDATAKYLTHSKWPSTGWQGWGELARVLRLDNIGPAESKAMTAALFSDSVRHRIFEHLSRKKFKSLYKTDKEQSVIEGLLDSLEDSNDSIDRIIYITCKLFKQYEQVASKLQIAFDYLRWELTQLNGQARLQRVLQDEGSTLQKVCNRLPNAVSKLKSTLEDSYVILENQPSLFESITTICEEGLVCDTPEKLVETIMTRHERVQREKNKGIWIERGETWVLLPGFGYSNEEPPNEEVVYIHPFRIANVYSFIKDLRLLR